MLLTRGLSAVKGRGIPVNTEHGRLGFFVTKYSDGVWRVSAAPDIASTLEGLPATELERWLEERGYVWAWVL